MTPFSLLIAVVLSLSGNCQVRPPSETFAGSDLDSLVAKAGIEIADCALDSRGRIYVLDAQEGAIYLIDEERGPIRFLDAADIGADPRWPLGHLRWRSETLIVSTLGRDGRIYSRQQGGQGQTSVLSLPDMVYDLDFSLRWSAFAPIGRAGDQHDDAVILVGAELPDSLHWGIRCPLPLDANDPLLALGCLWKVDFGSPDRLYAAQLNTGRCSCLLLPSLEASNFRPADDHAVSPHRKDSAIKAQKVLMDIAATDDDRILVLAIGGDKSQTLEFWEAGKLVRRHPLSRFYSGLACGGRRAVLFADNPQNRLHVFTIEQAEQQ